MNKPRNATYQQCIDLIDDACLHLEPSAVDGDGAAVKTMESLILVRDFLWRAQESSKKSKTDLNRRLTRALYDGQG